ncbi:PAQR family membrane homeostasis protein TrhA [Helcococcus sueciensis]|uniref:PAQR family membrane homeostasis protein TrhA n=1 Tax=Helcococcus sueciensis TaxID=241555 RepID=UPI0004220C16|nr:hemolysin III family protein [Helcococcus sueciensis]
MSTNMSKRDYFIYELLNSITHGIGVLIGIVFLVMLIVTRASSGNVVGIVSYSIYGATFILLFLMSTIYHAIVNEKAKKVLRIFDHISIYYFIAGSFTPIILMLMSGAWRIVFFVLMWTFAVIGTVFKIATHKNLDRFKSLSTLLYIAMGWMGVFLIRPIIQNTGWQLLLFIILGGVIYTIGTIFYKSNRYKYNHVIWHVFVLMAAVIHFLGFYFFL